MEIRATGKFDGRNVLVRWRDNEFFAPSDITEKIMMMNGTFKMEVLPSVITFRNDDVESVIHFMQHYLFDDEPKITGDLPNVEPNNTVF